LACRTAETTREFLDYFNLKALSELPSLQELRDIDSINAELDLDGIGEIDDGIHEVAADADSQVIPEDDAAENVQADEILH